MTYGIVSMNNKKEIETLENNSSKLESALEIYLSNHPDILYNVNNNFDGGIVSLEVLKNEGLISDKLKNVDYKDNYFLLSNAYLAPAKDDSECENSVSITTIKSWDLSKYDSSKVLYICPKNKEQSSGDVVTGDIKSYL